jgi:PAS domain S-box-containing protein
VSLKTMHGSQVTHSSGDAPVNAVHGAELDLVLEALPVGILMVDPSGVVSLVNATAASILGYERAELIGRPVEILLPQPLRARHVDDRVAFQTDPVQRKMGAGRDLFAVRKDGREIPVEIGLTPLTTVHGRFVLASIIDISERKAAEAAARKQQELMAARDALATKHQELLRTEHQKEELSALVVHDLRSPAAGIMMAAQSQLRRTSLSDSDRKLWGLVFASAQVINRMVLNLLDISSSNDGVFAPRPALVDVPALVTAVHQLMIPVAESMGQEIDVEAEARIPQLRADPELLRRILQNLIDNALRHGAAKARVLLKVETDDKTVTFRVFDTGPGVPVTMRDRIFDKYTRIPRQPGETGSFGKGLGLAFCRIAVEAHGGRIWVEDNLPKGSVFVVQLPTDRP